MPYIVAKQGKGPKPWKIIKKDTGEVVGSASSAKMAYISIEFREGRYKHGKKKS
jgi:hypothetical protein